MALETLKRAGSEIVADAADELHLLRMDNKFRAKSEIFFGGMFALEGLRQASESIATYSPLLALVSAGIMGLGIDIAWDGVEHHREASAAEREITAWTPTPTIIWAQERKSHMREKRMITPRNKLRSRQ